MLDRPLSAGIEPYFDKFIKGLLSLASMLKVSGATSLLEYHKSMFDRGHIFIFTNSQGSKF